MEYIGLLQDINLSSFSLLLLSIMTLKSKLLLMFGWYRVWTDLWCEQGSFILQIQNNTTVNYHKLFQYNATLSITQHNTSTSAPKFSGVYGSYFIIVDVSYGSTSKWCSWVAQGY